jgi:hypothetical protein
VSEVTRHVGHVRGGAGVEEPLRGAGWCAAGARGLKRYHQGGGVPGGWRGRWRAGEGHLILGRHGLLVVDGRARAQDAGTGGPKRQRPRLDKAGPRVVAGGPGELGGQRQSWIGEIQIRRRRPRSRYPHRRRGHASWECGTWSGRRRRCCPNRCRWRKHRWRRCLKSGRRRVPDRRPSWRRCRR